MPSTYFNADRLNADFYPEGSSWLREFSRDKESAFCQVCSRKFVLSNMAQSSVKSNSSGSKHLKNIAAMRKSVNISNMFKEVSKNGANGDQSIEHHSQWVSHTDAESAAIQSDIPLSSVKLTARISPPDYGMTNTMLKKDVIWALSFSSAHWSNHQAESIAKSFPIIFEDCKILAKFSVGKDKLRYMVNHGLYLHFKEKLDENIDSADFLAVSFDEAVNEISQKCRMDKHIRYINKKTGLTETRYLNSEFLCVSKNYYFTKYLGYKQILKFQNLS